MRLDSTFFNLYTGNNISYSTNGLIVGGPFWDSSGVPQYWPGYGYFGNSFRRNTLNNLVYDSVNLYGGEAASLGTSYYVPTGVTFTDTVFENNTGSNMYNGIDSSGMNGLIANTIYYKNNLSMGTNSGPYAVNFAASAQQTPALPMIPGPASPPPRRRDAARRGVGSALSQYHHQWHRRTAATRRPLC